MKADELKATLPPEFAGCDIMKMTVKNIERYQLAQTVKGAGWEGTVVARDKVSGDVFVAVPRPQLTGQ